MIDDEPDAIEVLTDTLAESCPHVKVVGTANSAEAGLQVLEAHKPDLLFLDIQMPRYSGFEVLRRLKKPTFQTIFVSAHPNHAVEAVKFQAMAYLLKPVSGMDLREAVALAEEALANHQEPDYEALLTNAEPDVAQKLAIPTGKGYRYFLPEEVIRVQAEKNYSNVYLQGDKKPILVSRNLKQFETLFAPLGFLRIHRGDLVNARHIREFQRQDGGTLVLTDGTTLLISRNHREAVQQYLKEAFPGM